MEQLLVQAKKTILQTHQESQQQKHHIKVLTSLFLALTF